MDNMPAPLDFPGTGPRLRHPVALIVLNHQRKALLLDCLSNASASLHSPCQIVVVDNGSTDGSAEAVQFRFPDVIVIRNGVNKGVAGGRNVGARWVLDNLDAEFLVFIDNDTFLEPDTVGEMVEPCLEDERIGLVAPKAYRRRGDRRLLSAGGLRFNPYTGTLSDVASGLVDDGQFDQPRNIQACPGFAFLVRRGVFKDIGLFDEHFNPYGWEDADLSLRAARAGYKIVYAPSAVAYHLGGRVARGAIAEYEYHKARAMFYFVKRHTTHTQWICFLLVFPFRSLARIARELLEGRSGIVRLWMDGFRGSQKH